ncbi:helix-turn-helix transcriptional regulator [Mycobacterium sp. CBMA360]|nr:helix-turn-helix transcriptional regulator [Mycolicibacterium sp. CBMA 360]
MTRNAQSAKGVDGPASDGEPEPRPLRSDAARNREAVLRAAAEVFAESGLNGSYDEIARRAGVGWGPSTGGSPSAPSWCRRFSSRRWTRSRQWSRMPRSGPTRGRPCAGLLSR